MPLTRGETWVGGRARWCGGWCLHRPDFDLRQGDDRGLDRRVALAAVGDQLGDHRVVIGADPVAFLDARIDADTPAEHKMIEPSGRGQKLLRRILGVKPRLPRPAVDAKLLLPLGRLLGRRDPELPFAQALAGTPLGPRMPAMAPRFPL